MTRRRRLPGAAVTFIFLITAFSINIAGADVDSRPADYNSTVLAESGSFKADGGASALSGEMIDASQILPASGEGGCPTNEPPMFVGFIEVDTLFICLGETIYDTLVADDCDPDQVITISQLSGPGTLTSMPSTAPAFGYFEFTPPSSGNYDAVFMAMDDHADSTVVTKTYVVITDNQPPVILNSDTAIFHCFEGDYYEAVINAYDPDGDQLSYTLLSGDGLLVPEDNSIIRFWANNEGNHCFIVEVFDGCSSDTAEICINATWNHIPAFSNPDQKFYICAIDSICFDIFATDQDANDSLVIWQTSGPGLFKMTTDTGGVTCFLPADVDSADYVFIYQASDRCLRGEFLADNRCPPEPTDTVVITVVRRADFTLDCPDDTTLFICAPDTLCFPIGQIPEGAMVDVLPPSAWYDAANGTVCFYTNCSVKKDIMVIVDPGYGIDSCQFTVDVVLNSPPLVMLPPDTSMFICENEEVCIPVGIIDADDNIESIVVGPNAWYNSITGRLCFDPPQSGDYTLFVIVTDYCGATDSDTINVHIDRNSSPVILMPADTSVSLCQLEEICIDVDISDVDYNIESIVVSPPGVYDAANEEVCFTPQGAGEFIITVSVTDSCGSEAIDSTIINVELLGAPTVVSAPDESLFMCEPEMFCFPVTITDPDNDIIEIRIYNEGTYNNEYVCFTPDSSGSYTFIIEAEDFCGNVASDTTVVDVTINRDPTMDLADDFEIFQCVFEEICFSAFIDDADSNIAIISMSNEAYYNELNDEICYTPTSAGVDTIIVTVSDSCIASVIDTIVITVTTAEMAYIECPVSPIELFICEGQNICYPLTFGPDDALPTFPWGVTYLNGEICFTPDTSGTYIIDVIVTAECGSDSCQIVFDVTIGEAPQLSCPPDTTIELCGADLICLPLPTPVENAVVTVSPIGYYENGKICFDVDTSGVYELYVEANNECGIANCTFLVTVNFNAPPVIISGGGEYFACVPGMLITHDVEATDNESDQIIYSLLSPYGTINGESGLISFTADSSGHYCFEVRAADECGADVETICVDVTINTAPELDIPADYAVNLCELQEICFPVDVFDADNNLVSIETSLGVYANGYICFTPTTSGNYTFIITATDECQAQDIKEITINISLNTAAPVVVLPEDVDTTLCEIVELCFGVAISDVDNNIYIISTNNGAWYDSLNSQICFTPHGIGEDTVIVTVTDSCLLSSADTMIVTVYLGETAQIECVTEPITESVCGTSTICYTFDFSPTDAVITVPEWVTYTDRQFCFTADTTGTYNVEVIADAECGPDTCTFSFLVEVGEVPQITCPANTTFELCAPELICLPFEFSPAEAVITVSQNGYYEDGMICFKAETEGEYNFLVEAANECGSVTCTFTVNILFNDSPEILTGDSSFFVCDPATLIEYQIKASDYENDELTFAILSGFGNIDPVSGLLSFTADSAGIYCFDVKAYDSCGADTSTICLTVDINEAPVVISGEDTTITTCAGVEICIPVDATDNDGNLVSVISDYGVYDNGEVCFTAVEDATVEIITTATDECGAIGVDTTVVTIVIIETPILSCPPDSTFELCNPEEICLPLGVTPDNAVITVMPFGSYSNGNICFYPETAGDYEFHVTAETACGLDSCDFTVTVLFNRPPEITTGDGQLASCELGNAAFTYDIDVIDPDDDPILFTLLSGDGTIDPVSGVISFTADSSGVYCFTVQAIDVCGASVSKVICITVNLNSAPVVVLPLDTTIVSCDWSEICIPVTVTDVDDNIESIQTNLGYYNNGQICFTPTEPGDYIFIVTAVDTCGATDSDTMIVGIEVGTPISLECPGDQIVSICAPDTLSFPISGVPEGADVTIVPPSAWYDVATGTVNFYTNCTVEKELLIVAENECGPDSCRFTVSVTMNSRPLVLLPPDKNLTMCELSEICIPVGIADLDDNITEIIVTPQEAVYNPISGRICFTPTTGGEHQIVVQAIDSCGAVDSDVININITLNSAPIVSAPTDIADTLCVPSEICFPVEISDIDNNIQSINISPTGTYDAASGLVCFTPDSGGVYQFSIIVTDSCGLTTTDITVVNVKMNVPPVVQTTPYTKIIICDQRDPICVPVTVTDVDNNIDSVTVVGGDYFGDLVCLTSADPGHYEIIITAWDSCGMMGADTAVIDIILNSAPVVQSAADFDVFQCIFEEICFGVDISDADDNIMIISVNMGTYNPQDSTICFTPDDTGSFVIITTAVDECQKVSSDTTIVTVTTGDVAQIDCPATAVYYSLCGPSIVCYQLDIQPQDAIVNTIPTGLYQDGQICFNADTAGSYIVMVTADAECGGESCQIEFIIDIDTAAVIECPNDTSLFLCEEQIVCLPVVINPDYAVVSVLPFGDYENGEICFNADTAGVYSMTIIAQTDCGSDTCNFDITVTFNAPPTVDAGSDSTVFQCTFEEICLSVSIVDDDNEIDSVIVTPVGYYNDENEEICFTPDDTGSFCLTLTAFDACGASGADIVCVTITTGDSAFIDCPPDPIEKRLCDPGQICIPLEITPTTAIVTVSYGVYVNNQICFYADTAGSYQITVTASESCYSDTCIITVNVVFDEYADIICPDLPINEILCKPGIVSVWLPIEPSSAEIIIDPIGVYDIANDTLTFFADTTGHYQILVTAETPCSIDSCLIDAFVTIDSEPEITCPEDIDTLVCIVEGLEICFDVDIIGGDEVTVAPVGYYSGGMVCIPVLQAGTSTIIITATSECGTAVCSVEVNISENLPPELTVPVDVLIPWCDDDTNQICIDGIYAVDPEGDPLTISLIGTFGEYTPINDDSGMVCFYPDNIDSVYEFQLQVTDGCSTDFKSLFVTVFPSAVCSVCVDVAIETDSCVVVGSRVPVYVTIETNDQVAGFDLLIGYDASTMIFMDIAQGTAISGWEYFTYRVIDAGGCGGTCPSGLVRLFAIADENDGPHHPPTEQLMPQGTLARIIMQVTNDQTIGGQYLPISFFWIDCGDNSFSDPSGIYQYVDARIYNASGSIIWDESDDILFPESQRWSGLGAPDSCLVGDKVAPVRCVYFHNGGICVKHPSDIDDRGDLNLNGVAYEIADAVVFTNYFIYGIDAFVINPDGQMAASDVNADGFALSVADLVYLIRVIVGDADAIPKATPDMARLELSIETGENNIRLKADTRCHVGAAHLVFKYSGVRPDPPEMGILADGMEMMYNITDSEIRIIIYSMQWGHAIDLGRGDLLNINFEGFGDIRLTEYSFATYHGEQIQARTVSGMLPQAFEVSQNYPNPFNPSTSIDLSLPQGGRWEMSIYNISGQRVRHFDGDSEAGITTVVWDGLSDDGQGVASGIYLYKVTAGEQSVSRKMILLK